MPPKACAAGRRPLAGKVSGRVKGEKTMRRVIGNVFRRWPQSGRTGFILQRRDADSVKGWASAPWRSAGERRAVPLLSAGQKAVPNCRGNVISPACRHEAWAPAASLRGKVIYFSGNIKTDVKKMSAALAEGGPAGLMGGAGRAGPGLRIFFVHLPPYAPAVPAAARRLSPCGRG